MKTTTNDLIEHFFSRYPVLISCKTEIINTVETIIKTYSSNNKVLTCGNGGSAADAQHIVGELMKGFVLGRRTPSDKRTKVLAANPDIADKLNENLQDAIPAISLIGELALDTAFANDVDPSFGFAQQVYGIANSGDTLIAISTSGNSKNVLYAVGVAKALGVNVVALTGENGGKLKETADISICVPSNITYQIQEYHLPIYHVICLAVENELFGD
ncbi:phosphoheptose isomerase [Clostridia bacterium]|nr:phosphoheptose isomerase [Clostridia bacterium]